MSARARRGRLGVDAVALFGTSARYRQTGLLRQRRWLVLLDGHEAGRAAAGRLTRALAAPAIELPAGSDPADLPDRQLAGLLRAFFSSNQPCRGSVPAART